MDINSKNKEAGMLRPGMPVTVYGYRVSDSTAIPGIDVGGELYLQLDGMLSAAMSEAGGDTAAFNGLAMGISSYVRQSGGACIVHACGEGSMQACQHVYVGRQAMESYMNTLDPSSQAMDLLARALSVFRVAETAGVSGVGSRACCGAVYTGAGNNYAGHDFTYGVGICLDPEHDPDGGRRIGVCPAKIALAGLALIGAVCAAVVWKRSRP